MERQYSLSGDCKETETRCLKVVTCLAVNTLNAYGETMGEGQRKQLREIQIRSELCLQQVIQAMEQE